MIMIIMKIKTIFFKNDKNKKGLNSGELDFYV